MEEPEKGHKPKDLKVEMLLEELSNFFPYKLSKKLTLQRDIKFVINLVLKISLLNLQANTTKLIESTKLPRQVEELLQK